MNQHHWSYNNDNKIQQCLQTVVLSLSLLILFLSMKTSKITIRILMFISTKGRLLPQIQATILRMRFRGSKKNFQQKLFSDLHLHICSMSKILESFREILDSLSFTFSAICLSETRCQPHETSNQITWLRKLTSDQEKLQRMKVLHFITSIPFLQSQR